MNKIKVLLRHQRGLGMLELAIALPILVLLALGVFDLARIFHLQNALQSTIETTAREVTTLSGTGASHHIDTRMPRYEWRIVERKSAAAAPTERSLGKDFGETDTPSECGGQDALHRCQRVFARFEGTSPTHTTVDLPQALSKVGYEELTALIPSARHNCAGVHCAQFSFEHANGVVDLEVHYDLPLSLLLGEPLTLSAKTQRTFEGEFFSQVPVLSTCKRRRFPDGKLRAEC